MNGWEIGCVIFGMILLFSLIESDYHFKNVTWKEMFTYIFPDLVKAVIGAVLILLPMYFNYWR